MRAQESTGFLLIVVEITTFSGRGKTEIHILHGGTLILRRRFPANRNEDIPDGCADLVDRPSRNIPVAEVSDNYVQRQRYNWLTLAYHGALPCPRISRDYNYAAS